MLFAAAIVAALLNPAQPECGAVGLPDIDRAAFVVVNQMRASAGDSAGRPSTRFFAEPLATALEDEYRRWDRGETPRLARDWLTGGGAMNGVTDVSLYSLNRSGVDDMDMQLGFTNAEGEVVYRRLKLRCHDGRWRIDYIFLGDEEGYLNDRLAPAP
jgi:hypothetical protein